VNLVELYEQTPVERHSDIIVSDNMLFFDNGEYIIQGDGELKLVRGNKELLQKLDQIRTKLGIGK